MEDGFISYSTRADGERYFTNADMARMVEQGLIDPEDRWELIRGAWFAMGSEGFEHMDLRVRIINEIVLQFGRQKDVLVGSEGSIFFSMDTELRPDVILYRANVGTNEMKGDDIFLVAEIMKSSVRRDMELKRPVYAAAGVPELWLIDLDAKTVLVCRSPDTEDGCYIQEKTIGFGDMLDCAAFPALRLVLQDLF